MKWSLQSRKIKDLKAHPKNPRKLTKEQYKQLGESIAKFDLIDKPIVNHDNTIIGGHQRIEVLKKNKVCHVDCWVPDEPIQEKDVEELMLRLNRNHGEFDYDILANSFEVPDLIDYGFTVTEMDLLLEHVETEEQEPTKKKKKECPNCGYAA
jgi:hypothetical protein